MSNFINQTKIGGLDKTASLFKSNSLLSDLYLSKFKEKTLESFFRKAKNSNLKRKNRWFTARRKIRGSKINTALGFFRRKVNKLVGVWFLRRRRRIRRKFRLLMGARTHTSKFGLWVNNTKVFKDLKAVVCRKYADYAQRAILLSKKITYSDYGSGIVRTLLGYGRFDYSKRGGGVQYFNNKANLSSLTDYFVYSHNRQHTLPVVLYPESAYEQVEQKGTIAVGSGSGFDLTLFESRTAFWESYVGTPTSKFSFLKTEFKTIASSILISPVSYTDRFNTFTALVGSVNKNKRNLLGKMCGVSLTSLRKRYFRKS